MNFLLIFAEPFSSLKLQYLWRVMSTIDSPIASISHAKKAEHVFISIFFDFCFSSSFSTVSM